MLAGHDDAVSSLAFTPDGRTLLSASGDDTLRAWALSSPRAGAPRPPPHSDGTPRSCGRSRVAAGGGLRRRRARPRRAPRRGRRAAAGGLLRSHADPHAGLLARRPPPRRRALPRTRAGEGRARLGRGVGPVVGLRSVPRGGGGLRGRHLAALVPPRRSSARHGRRGRLPTARPRPTRSRSSTCETAASATSHPRGARCARGLPAPLLLSRDATSVLAYDANETSARVVRFALAGGAVRPLSSHGLVVPDAALDASREDARHRERRRHDPCRAALRRGSARAVRPRGLRAGAAVLARRPLARFRRRGSARPSWAGARPLPAAPAPPTARRVAGRPPLVDQRAGRAGRPGAPGLSRRSRAVPRLGEPPEWY